MKLLSTNPSKNYSNIGSVDISSKNEIKKIVDQAKRASEAWKDMGLDARIKILSDVFAVFKSKKNSERLAELMSEEMGMPIKEAREDLMYGNEFLGWYLESATKLLAPEVTYEDKEQIHRVYREPYGVVAVIVPWNFPFSNFVWQTGQNLIAGNVVVFKHSEEVPLFSKEVNRLIAETKLPKGVFGTVYGDGKVGDYLVHQDINMICFTGSSQVGNYLYKVGAEKFIPVLMELGGSAPGIIFSDADLDSVMDTVFVNKFLNCGQVCDGLKRLIVQKDVYDDVVSRLVSIAKAKKIGDALMETTDIGPLVSKKQLNTLISQVKDAKEKGVKIAFGGNTPEGLKGAYFEPTILTNIKKTMRVWKEEVFGPVLPVVKFDTEEEAIELANDTKYGLGSYIFTKDKKKFQRVASNVKAGMVGMNNCSYVKPCNPFGGYKYSGLGREHGAYGFHDVTQVKVVAEEK